MVSGMCQSIFKDNKQIAAEDQVFYASHALYSLYTMLDLPCKYRKMQCLID